MTGIYLKDKTGNQKVEGKPIVLNSLRNCIIMILFGQLNKYRCIKRKGKKESWNMLVKLGAVS